MSLKEKAEAAIFRLEEKKRQIESELEEARRFRASLDRLSEGFLFLLDEREFAPRNITEAYQATNNFQPTNSQQIANSQEIEHESEELHQEDDAEQVTSDLKDKTIIECAKQILKEHPGKSLHFSVIAKAAQSRGYSSGRTDNKETLYKSFWAMLNRTKDVFEATNRGCYRLKDDANHNSIEPQHMNFDAAELESSLKEISENTRKPGTIDVSDL